MKRVYASLAACAVLLSACGDGSSNNNRRVNLAPTIAPIAQQTTVANAVSDPIGFSVSDEQPDGLAISVTSDRQQVVPDSGLSLSGAGANRTITATPVVDMTGETFITVVATDTGGLSASASFLLVVSPEQRSMQQFARDVFATDADDEPELINAVDFVLDAENDDFADLLTP